MSAAKPSFIAYLSVALPIVGSTLACLWYPAFGQPHAPVTEADVQRAARSQPAITDADIAAAAKKFALPSPAEMARVPIPKPVRIDALPQPNAQRPVDIGAIARGFDQIAGPSSSALKSKAQATLVVFVSFAMPEAVLQRLVDQAALSGSTLVLRGLVEGGSLVDTVLRVQRLIGQKRVAFQIDPQAFDRFSISSTPTFVLLKAGALPAPCAAGTCFPESNFVSVAGDVSIDYALEFFQRSSPTFGRDAGEILARMKR